jgi:hypothetical protein
LGASEGSGSKPMSSSRHFVNALADVISRQ